MKCGQESVCGDLRLTQQTRKRADLDLRVHGHDAALGLAARGDVAAALTKAPKAESLQSANDLRTREVRELRPVRAQAP